MSEWFIQKPSRDYDEVFISKKDPRYMDSEEDYMGIGENCLHVIEYSALVAERARVAALQDEITTMKYDRECINVLGHEKIVGLESELTTLRAQLELCKEQRNKFSDECGYGETGKEKWDAELQKKGQGDE